MPVVVIITILFFWLLRTIRWYILLKASDINVNFFYLYLVGSISIAFATITPFMSGEALKVELLKKTGDLERIPGYGIFITERILDLIIVLSLAVLSTILGVSKFIGSEIIFSAAGLILVCLLIILIVIRRISPNNSLGRFFQPFNQCVKNWKILVTVIFLTIGGWLFIIAGWYISFRSIYITISFLETTAVTTITTLLGIISLIPWSLGISEVSISSSLTYLKNDTPLAQAGALIVRVYGVVTLFTGFVHLLIWKFVRIKKQIPESNES